MKIIIRAIRQIKILFIFIMMIGIIYSCLSKKEIEAFQSIQNIEAPKTRCSAFIKFISDYPESDSISKAIGNILQILGADSDDSESAIQFAIDQLLIRSDPQIRTTLYQFIFTNLYIDTATIDHNVNNALHYDNMLPLPSATSIALLPYLDQSLSSDSIRNKLYFKFGAHLLQSEYSDAERLIFLSDKLLECSDSGLIDLSNKFLTKAIQNTTFENLSIQYSDAQESAVLDSLRRDLNFRLYLKLAWNAFHQGNYQYALNLISQVSKYGSLERENALILLGAIQAQTGELIEGWGHILQGLVLNPTAERQFPEIEQIYISLFRRIRGSRENPTRFLAQYRRSHR
ncbi:hypothetical protein KJ656_07120 [bacterium]|nr:hypothetical protein [bacterium]